MSSDTNTKVELYIYDLSRGLASQLSRQLLGRHFEGVWHTSIVVHWTGNSSPQEYFFGGALGIEITRPGGSHHGSPVQIMQMGETEIDYDTWNVILEDLRDRYRPEAYNLMNFNCNNFSNDVANILIGNDIPEHITSLPTDFQSALGGMMGNSQGLAGLGPSGGLQSSPFSAPTVGTSSQTPTSSATSVPSASGASPPNLLNVQTLSELNNILTTRPCSVVLFTNTRTCPPCKMIHPVFVDLANEIALKEDLRKIAFVVVDSQPALMAQYSISGTPTFKFYIGAQERHTFSGADRHELKSQIDLTLFDTYITHPHSNQHAEVLQKVPRAPITFDASPNYSGLTRKLDESIAALKLKTFNDKAQVQEARSHIVKVVIGKLGASNQPSRFGQEDVVKWSKASLTLMKHLSLANCFPVIDLLRIGLAKRVLSLSTAAHQALVSDAWTAIHSRWEEENPQDLSTIRSTYLVMCRFVCNVLGHMQSQESSRSVLESISAFVHQGLSASPPLISAAADESSRTQLLTQWDSRQSSISSAAFNLFLLSSRSRSDFILKSSPAAPPGFDLNSSDVGIEYTSAILESLSSWNSFNQISVSRLRTLNILLCTLFLLLYRSPVHEDVRETVLVLEGQQTFQAIKKNLVALEGDHMESEEAKIREEVQLILTGILRLVQ
ncbi:unnamed protein product [Sympodiomycopsis kandeliae]